MKTIIYAISPLKTYCYFFGHKYEQTKQITHHVKEYTCSCCNKQVTIDSDGKLIELTQKRKEINLLLAKIYNKKVKVSKLRPGIKMTAA